MAALVREGMAAGAIGWSTSLSPTHFFGDGTPAPSRLADEAELLALARALADLERGVIEIAPRTTIGPPADKAEEQRSFAGLARASGKVGSWAPLLDNPFAPGSAQQIIAEAAELQARGAQVVPQVGCRPLEVRFDFTEPAFYLEQNPFWRPIMAKSRDERRRLFADAEFRAELSRQTGFVAALAQGWDRLVLRLAASEGLRRWQDRSVAATAVPAERYGLHGRGRLAPGYAADLVLFDPARVAMRPTEMVYDLPRGQRRLLQRAEGIVDVLVNGTPVVADGAPTGRRPGRVLRGGV